jgi:hypothetical protein
MEVRATRTRTDGQRNRLRAPRLNHIGSVCVRVNQKCKSIFLLLALLVMTRPLEHSFPRFQIHMCVHIQGKEVCHATAKKFIKKILDIFFVFIRRRLEKIHQKSLYTEKKQITHAHLWHERRKETAIKAEGARREKRTDIQVVSLWMKRIQGI